MRLIKEKDLPDFENLRSAVWWVMKVSISSFIVLLYTFSNHSMTNIIP